MTSTTAQFVWSTLMAWKSFIFPNGLRVVSLFHTSPMWKVWETPGSRTVESVPSLEYLRPDTWIILYGCLKITFTVIIQCFSIFRSSQLFPLVGLPNLETVNSLKKKKTDRGNLWVKPGLIDQTCWSVDIKSTSLLPDLRFFSAPPQLKSKLVVPKTATTTHVFVNDQTPQNHQIIKHLHHSSPTLISRITSIHQIECTVEKTSANFCSQATSGKVVSHHPQRCNLHEKKKKKKKTKTMVCSVCSVCWRILHGIAQTSNSFKGKWSALLTSNTPASTLWSCYVCLLITLPGLLYTPTPIISMKFPIAFKSSMPSCDVLIFIQSSPKNLQTQFKKSHRTKKQKHKQKQTTSNHFFLAKKKQ